MHPALPYRPAAALAAALAACSSPPPPPPPFAAPAIETRLEQFRGGILEGSSTLAAADAPIDTTDLWRVDAQLVYVDRLPEALDPLAAKSRLIVGTRGGRPLLSASLLTAGARVGIAEPRSVLDREVDGRAIRSLPVATIDALLPVGTTAVFTGETPEPRLLDDGALVHRTVGVLVSRGTSALDDVGAPTVSLLVEDLEPEVARRATDDTGPDPARMVQRQLVIVDDRPAVDGEPMVILFPSPFEGDGGFLVSVRVARVTGSPADLDARLAECRARLDHAAASATARATGVPAAESDVRALQSGIDALGMAAHHRPALVFLAGSAGAPLALDFALTAADTTLAEWVQAVERDLGAIAAPEKLSPGERDRIAFGLEKAAWLLAIEHLDRDTLPSELEGVLLRHAGEAGRFAATLRGVVDRATDIPSVETGLVRENQALLESTDPAARVRAYDWLVGHDAAPASFDPLADREARRDALRAARDAAAAAATPTDAPAGETADTGSTPR